MIAPAAHEVTSADLLVVIGTSLNVYPAAGLLQYCRPGVPIYLIDPNPVNTNVFQHVKQLQMGASEGMKRLTELLNSASSKETKD